MKYKNYEQARAEIWKELIGGLYIGGESPIILFGCGWMGTELVKCFGKDIRERLVGFCDNNKSLWGTKKYNIEIRSPKESLILFPEAIFIIAIARGALEVKKQLIDIGIAEEKIRVFRLNDNGVAIRGYLSERLGAKYEIDYDFPAEADVPVVRSVDRNEKRDFRVSIDEYLGRRLDNNELFDAPVIDEYEKCYGKYLDISENKNEGEENSVIIMIAKSHMDYSNMELDNPDIYIPIQAGSALTDKDICDLKDNQGENISDRNYNYCECSVLYWAWKNGFAKEYQYLGLRHYRRKFEISVEQLRHLSSNGIDIVHLDPMYHEDIRARFSFHTKNDKDWDVMKQAIHTVFPEYDEAMRIYENQHFVIGYNMSILRRDIFDDYCNFLFGVLTYVEDYYLKRCDRRDRYLGFLAENLFGIYLIKNKNKYTHAVTKLVPYIKY
ncbi:DUF4422 domain-containing protein [Butyrivibrio sp. X503]|uniref:DUF4422 domain-containing protein n=1 Tax=Butyrivibrio sp. X503 TaxID=2364878 RepID=UPI001313ED28|nr:DUF4422 domain-containing protein [Butyrivibrio sp. X503]